MWFFCQLISNDKWRHQQQEVYCREIGQTPHSVRSHSEIRKFQYTVYISLIECEADFKKTLMCEISVTSVTELSTTSKEHCVRTLTPLVVPRDCSLGACA